MTSRESGSYSCHETVDITAGLKGLFDEGGRISEEEEEESGKGRRRRRRRKLQLVICKETNLLRTGKVIEHQILPKKDQFSHLEYREQFRNQQPNPLLVFHPLSQFFPVALIAIEYPGKEKKAGEEWAGKRTLYESRYINRWEERLLTDIRTGKRQNKTNTLRIDQINKLEIFKLVTKSFFVSAAITSTAQPNYFTSSFAASVEKFLNWIVSVHDFYPLNRFVYFNGGNY